MCHLRLLARLLTLGTFALTCLMAQLSWGGQERMNLSPADQEFLLKLARDSIQLHLKGEKPPPLKSASPILQERRGAFVTLYRKGRLRGCIGYLEAVKPLGQTVMEMATAAAFHDPRFSPLRGEELADLEVEISVLSPMSLIKNSDEIEVGKHGLYIVRGLNRGLLLPQVATEYRWDRLTFLEQTCLKAGLPPDAWKNPVTQIYVFTAQIISEQPGKPGCLRQESKNP